MRRYTASLIPMTQMTQYEIEGLWLEKRLDVAYMFGDTVLFKSGETS